MGGRLLPPSPRVAIADKVEYCRAPHDDELMVMEDFARHADHCDRCNFPRVSKGLCNRGNSLARTLAEYVYQKNGRAFAVSDKVRRNESVRVEIPAKTRNIEGQKFDMQPVRGLLVAASNGLDITRRATPSPVRQPILHQPVRSTSLRQPTERRPEADLVTIRPGGKREERREQRREAESRPSRPTGRGSLYRSDEEARARRARDALDPVIVVAAPRGKYYR